MAEIVEDVCLVLDIVFTMVAVIFTKLNMENYSKVCYSFSGAFLIIALIAMAIKRSRKNKKKL